MKLLKGLTSGKNKYVKIGGIAVVLALALYFGPKLLKNKTSGRVPNNIVAAGPIPVPSTLGDISSPVGGATPMYTPVGAFRANSRVGISPLRQKILV